jgi:hypothetical protein
MRVHIIVFEVPEQVVADPPKDRKDWGLGLKPKPYKQGVGLRERLLKRKTYPTTTGLKKLTLIYFFLTAPLPLITFSTLSALQNSQSILSYGVISHSSLPRLYVEGNQIRDSKGPVFLIGCCYDGEAREYPGTDFWTYANEAAEVVKGYGFNCIRLTGCYWSLLEISQNPEEFIYDQKYLQHIIDTVEAFGKRGIYVILDLHKTPMEGDIQSLAKFVPWSGVIDDFADEFYTDTGPYSAREHLKRVWLMLSDIFKDNWSMAGYDILNEPYHRGAIDSQTISDYCWEMVDYVTAALRSNGDEHIVFVEPAPWETFRFMNRKLNDPNIVYEIHFYRGLNTSVFPPTVVNSSLNYLGDHIGEGWSYCNRLKEFNVPFIVGEYANMFYTGGDILPDTPEDTYLRNTLRAFHEYLNMCGHFHYRYEAYGPNQSGTGSGWQEIAIEATLKNK